MKIRPPIPTLFAGALLFTSCTSDKATMDEVTYTRVGVTGGTATSPDGKVTLRFPDGSLASAQEISIRVLRQEKRSDSASAIYELGPEQVFNRPVEITIQVDRSGGDDQLVLANLDQTEAALLEDSYESDDGLAVHATLAHFSRYGVVRRPNPCASLSCGDPCGTNKRCNFNARCVPDALPLYCQPGGPDGGGDWLDASHDGGIEGPDGGGARFHAPEVEPNDDAASAMNVGLGVGFLRTIDATLTPGDVDWYAFDVPQGYTANARLVTHSDPDALGICDPPLDTTLILYDAALGVLAQNDDANGRCSEINPFTHAGAANLQPGRYYVRVAAFAPITSPVTYYLTLVHENTGGFDGGVSSPDGGGFFPDGGGVNPDSGLAPDAGSPQWFESEPNGSAAQATPLPLWSSLAARYATGDEDWYSFEVYPGWRGAFRAQTHTDFGNIEVCRNLDTEMTLFDASLGVIAENDDRPGSFCSEISGIRHPVNSLAPGIYYLRVRPKFQAPANTPYYLYSELYVFMPSADGGPASGWDATFGSDSGSGSFLDAGSPFDAGQAGFDAGQAGPDASQSFPDSGLPPADGGSSGPLQEAEYNGDRLNANQLPYQAVTRIQAALTPAGDVDYFRFNIPAGAVLSMAARTFTSASDPTQCAPGTDTVLELVDDGGNVLATNDDATSATRCSELNPQGNAPAAANLQPGAYYLRVRQFAPNTISQLYYLEMALF